MSYDRIPSLLFHEHPLLDLTLRLIRIAHGSQQYNGAPYFHHPIRVMLRMNFYNITSDDLYAALLHDVLEDTEITVDDLYYFGYNEATISMVQNLSREKDGDQTYKEYVKGLLEQGHMWSIRIKLADLYENSNNVRFLPPAKRKVLVRYGKSIKEIQDYLTQSSEGAKILDNTISGELDEPTLEAWIRQKPTFL